MPRSLSTDFASFRLCGVVGVIGIVALLLAAPASAGMVISTGAGVFEPWDGTTGYEIDGAILATIGRTQSWRLGGEFSYRSAETDILNAKDIDFESYRLSFVAHYRFMVGQVIEPYIGGRISVAVNVVDGDDIERQRPFTRVEDVGTGVGGAAIVGLDIPLGAHFALYGEASIGGDLQLTEETRSNDDYDVENIGGVSGIAGIRLRF